MTKSDFKKLIHFGKDEEDDGLIEEVSYDEAESRKQELLNTDFVVGGDGIDFMFFQIFGQYLSFNLNFQYGSQSFESCVPRFSQSECKSWVIQKQVKIC